MLSSIFRSLAAPAALLALGACSSQAATSYPGQPLATLSGTVNTKSSSASGAMDAALVWANVHFSPNQQFIESVNWVDESTPVSGQFPASFTLNVYTPPPASVLTPCPSSSANAAVAFVVAVPAGGNIGNGPVAHVTGEAYGWMVVYLDRDEPAGTSCAPGFTFAPTKGFHLVKEVSDSVEPRYLGACYPAFTEVPGGPRTPLTITLGGNGPVSPLAGCCMPMCVEKATSCGETDNSILIGQCEQLCATSPTDSQLLCFKSTDCLTIANATGSLCGISAGGTASLDAGLSANPDAGNAPDAP